MTNRVPRAGLILLSLCSCTSSPEPGDMRDVPDSRIGTAVYVGDAEIRPYRPDAQLVVAVTPVAAARFPAVDIHCHWSLEQDPHEMLRAMDERNVRVAVNLSGGWGEKLERMMTRYHDVAPGRLVILCNIDFARIDEPGFGETMRSFLIDARARGVSGLKIFKDLGLRIRDGSGALVAVDDPRLDPIWATCGELGMPVLIHSGDPAAFFAPIDGRNERWMQLRRRPSWSFHGPQFPAREIVMEQRNRMIRRHARTTFICAHLGGYAEDLAAAGRFLDAHPNAVLDISGRVAELGRQPYSSRRFLTGYQDRILFGTDRYPGRPDQPRYRVYFRFLETEDEYFEYHEHAFPPTGEWRIYGVGLPDDILRKVYAGNAVRVLGMARAGGTAGAGAP